MSETPFKLDREKYLRLARSEGVQAALTRLHLDTERWEHTAFEGEKGWQPALWQELEAVRKFSRELWAIDLEQPGKKA